MRETVAGRAYFTQSPADAKRATPGGAALFDTALWVFTALIALIAIILGLDWLVRADTFPVRAVRFEGEFKRVSQSELQDAVMDSVRGSFLRLDLDAVKGKVESVPWVQSAAVRRAWPRDVYVRFTEQKLLAHWNDGAWVNQALEAVHVPVQADMPASAPWLEGPDGAQAQVFTEYQALNKLLQASGLELTRLTLTPRRTWRVELSNDVVLVLDREEVEHKIDRFAQAWPLLARDGRAIHQVDLRYTNGFAVQWKAARTRVAGEG
jgi:cell division protein FtsQ